jgi:hypothetical protein
MKHSLTLRSILLLAGLGLVAGASRAESAGERPAATSVLPTSTMLGVESVRLPQGERLGLVGASMLFEVDEAWGIGPAVYGAATGQRGGLFVGGVEVQRRMAIGRSWMLATGLYAGGGGGGAAPVGSGLMLRPAATLLYDLGRTSQVGISWSMVKFPSGQIDSRQLGLTFAWGGDFRYHDAGRAGESVYAGRASGLGFDRMGITVGTYRYTDGVDGTVHRIGLVGARAERRSGIEGVTLSLEAAAAAQGSAAGYMEILGSAGWSIQPLAEALPGVRIGARAALGMGGGGAVPTGGGAMARLSATVEASPAKGWTIGAELGRTRSFNGGWSARSAQLWAGLDLEPALDGLSEPRGPIVRTEWSGVLQHLTRAERKDSGARPLDTIGLKLTRFVTPNLYITGQAHSAFAGGAGAYSVGLVGAGVATRADAGLRGGVEALIGAAGGGGVATSGGAISQGMAWVGWGRTPDSEWRAGVGTVRALRGGVRSPVIELSWTRAFGYAGR